MNLHQIIMDLLRNPGSENEPEPWLTRLMAHKAVGTYLFCVAMVFTFADPFWAALAASLVYALVETAEWALAAGRRSWALLWDCILDWSGVTSNIAIIWAAWENDLFIMLAFMVVGLGIAQAGVMKRAR